MRGDVHVLPAPRDAKGHEQQGRRYVIVLQSDLLSNLTTVVGVPTTTRDYGTAHQPQVRLAGSTAYALCEQVRVYDRRRLGRQVARLSTDELGEVEDGLRLVLGLL